MGTFDTLTVADGTPFRDEVCNTEFQVKLSHRHSDHEVPAGGTYQISEDMELLVQRLGLKDGVELAEDEEVRPDQLEEYWDTVDFSGSITLSGGPRQPIGLGENMDVVVEDGEVVDYDPTVVSIL